MISSLSDVFICASRLSNICGVDDICLSELTDLVGFGSLDYATVICQGNLVIETGFFATDRSSNSESTLDMRIYIDVDGIETGAPF